MKKAFVISTLLVVLTLSLGGSVASKSADQSETYEQLKLFTEVLSIVQNQYGMSVPQFEEKAQEQVLMEKLRRLVSSGATVSDDDLQKEFHLRNDKMKIDFVALKNADLKDKVKLSDEDINAYNIFAEIPGTDRNAGYVMAGAIPSLGALLGAVALGIGAVILAQVWAVATWAADRWIARARLEP